MASPSLSCSAAPIPTATTRNFSLPSPSKLFDNPASPSSPSLAIVTTPVIPPERPPKSPMRSQTNDPQPPSPPPPSTSPSEAECRPSLVGLGILRCESPSLQSLASIVTSEGGATVENEAEKAVDRTKRQPYMAHLQQPHSPPLLSTTSHQIEDNEENALKFVNTPQRALSGGFPWLTTSPRALSPRPADLPLPPSPNVSSDTVLLEDPPSSRFGFNKKVSSATIGSNSGDTVYQSAKSSPMSTVTSLPQEDGSVPPPRRKSSTPSNLLLQERQLPQLPNYVRSVNSSNSYTSSKSPSPSVSDDTTTTTERNRRRVPSESESLSSHAVCLWSTPTHDVPPLPLPRSSNDSSHAPSLTRTASSADSSRVPSPPPILLTSGSLDRESAGCRSGVDEHEDERDQKERIVNRQAMINTTSYYLPPPVVKPTTIELMQQSQHRGLQQQQQTYKSNNSSEVTVASVRQTTPTPFSESSTNTTNGTKKATKRKSLVLRATKSLGEMRSKHKEKEPKSTSHYQFHEQVKVSTVAAVQQDLAGVDNIFDVRRWIAAEERKLGLSSSPVKMPERSVPPSPSHSFDNRRADRLSLHPASLMGDQCNQGSRYPSLIPSSPIASTATVLREMTPVPLAPTPQRQNSPLKPKPSSSPLKESSAPAPTASSVPCSPKVQPPSSPKPSKLMKSPPPSPRDRTPQQRKDDYDLLAKAVSMSLKISSPEAAKAKQGAFSNHNPPRTSLPPLPPPQPSPMPAIPLPSELSPDPKTKRLTAVEFSSSPFAKELYPMTTIRKTLKKTLLSEQLSELVDIEAKPLSSIAPLSASSETSTITYQGEPDTGLLHVSSPLSATSFTLSSKTSAHESYTGTQTSQRSRSSSVPFLHRRPFRSPEPHRTSAQVFPTMPSVASSISQYSSDDVQDESQSEVGTTTNTLTDTNEDWHSAVASSQKSVAETFGVSEMRKEDLVFGVHLGDSEDEESDEDVEDVDDRENSCSDEERTMPGLLSEENQPSDIKLSTPQYVEYNVTSPTPSKTKGGSFLAPSPKPDSPSLSNSSHSDFEPSPTKQRTSKRSLSSTRSHYNSSAPVAVVLQATTEKSTAPPKYDVIGNGRRRSFSHQLDPTMPITNTIPPVPVPFSASFRNLFAGNRVKFDNMSTPPTPATPPLLPTSTIPAEIVEDYVNREVKTSKNLIPIPSSSPSATKTSCQQDQQATSAAQRKANQIEGWRSEGLNPEVSKLEGKIQDFLWDEKERLQRIIAGGV